METIRGTGGFLILVKAIERAGLADMLSSEGPFTLFAPTDGAFERLPAGVYDDLMEDPDTLRIILRYHVLTQKLMLEDIIAQKRLTSFDGEDLMIGESIYGPLINDSKIITPDIACSNGVIHAINYVLFPGIVRVRGGSQAPVLK